MRALKKTFRPVYCLLGLLLFNLCHCAFVPVVPKTVWDFVASGDLPAVKGEMARDRSLLKSTDPLGNTLLHKAAWAGKTDVLKYLLAEGIDVNVKNTGGRTPLFFAVKGDRYRAVVLLADAGAAVDVADANGETPLFECAVSSCSLEIAGFLIRKGANVRVRNYYRSTPLHYSFLKNNEALSRLLISKGADLSARDKAQKTPNAYGIDPGAGKPSVRQAVDATVLSQPYYALVIGNGNYKYLPKLKTPRDDAQAMAGILRDRYGFRTDVLLDARRSDIVLALNKYRKTLKHGDNLLIFYAGHGILDSKADEGYWLPVDATRTDPLNWISNSFITGTLKAMEAKHVLIIADSCYAGKLTRSIDLKERKAGYLTRLSQKRTRVVMSSGGVEPVLDSGGKGNHSIFASVLLDALRENDGIMEGQTLFTKIRRLVMVNADQTPEYADIRKAGHDGGDFLFVPRKPHPSQ